jgi:hypothetical protein
MHLSQLDRFLDEFESRYDQVTWRGDRTSPGALRQEGIHLQ